MLHRVLEVFGITPLITSSIFHLYTVPVIESHLKFGIESRIFGTDGGVYYIAFNYRICGFIVEELLFEIVRRSVHVQVLFAIEERRYKQVTSKRKKIVRGCRHLQCFKQKRKLF
jgi:hypothetical protein